jgi:histidinol dehydrogenase
VSIPIVPWEPGTPCERLQTILKRNEGPSAQVVEQVLEIIEHVRSRGDEALCEYAARFDGVQMSPADLVVGRERLERFARGLEPGLLDALERAADNIRSFHEHQKQVGFRFKADDGVVLGIRVRPIGSAGLYVPGGTAAYPSSVLMNALPALVAGVERLVAVTPPKALETTPALAAALQIVGVDEVYAVGGAHAIAALAYGTESIKRVHKIVGPGNLWVATAKRLVFGAVGIDSFAGPSEVVVVADRIAEPSWVAADLLAQAEHDTEAAAIAIVWDSDLAERIAAEVDRQLAELPRRDIAGESIRQFGAIFVCLGPEAGCRLVNLLAPEHVELLVEDPTALEPRIVHAGAIFLGPWTPEAVGDYYAGPNHVLPTSGTARFSSPLGVWDFVKRTSIIQYNAARLAGDGPDIVMLAQAEGLVGHARSVAVRLGDMDP